MSTKSSIQAGRRELQKLKGWHKSKILQSMRSMDPILFEHLTGALFEERGYRVKTTVASGDEGVDVHLRKGFKSAVVQCKRYAHSVGQPVIRDLYGTMLHNKADEAYLVTTGSLTKQAKEWSQGKPIHLVDGFTLVQWIVETKEPRWRLPHLAWQFAGVVLLLLALLFYLNPAFLQQWTDPLWGGENSEQPANDAASPKPTRQPTKAPAFLEKEPSDNSKPPPPTLVAPPTLPSPEGKARQARAACRARLYSCDNR